MAESVYQQAGVQHLAYLAQHRSQIPGVHNPWEAEAHLEAHLQQQRALVAVQHLEQQRLQRLSQDSAESQHL